MNKEEKERYEGKIMEMRRKLIASQGSSIILCIMMSIGIVIAFMLPEMNTASVGLDALDEACWELTGDNTSFFKDRFGGQMDFVCVIPPPPCPDEGDTLIDIVDGGTAPCQE